MEAATWDIDAAAASAVQNGVVFGKRYDKAFAFESTATSRCRLCQRRREPPASVRPDLFSFDFSLYLFSLSSPLSRSLSDISIFLSDFKVLASGGNGRLESPAGTPPSRRRPPEFVATAAVPALLQTVRRKNSSRSFERYPVVFKVYPGQQVGGPEADLMAANELSAHASLQNSPFFNNRNHLIRGDVEA